MRAAGGTERAQASISTCSKDSKPLRAPICCVVAALPVLMYQHTLRSGSRSALQLGLLAGFEQNRCGHPSAALSLRFRSSCISIHCGPVLAPPCSWGSSLVLNKTAAGTHLLRAAGA